MKNKNLLQRSLKHFYNSAEIGYIYRGIVPLFNKRKKA